MLFYVLNLATLSQFSLIERASVEIFKIDEVHNHPNLRYSFVPKTWST